MKDASKLVFYSRNYYWYCGESIVNGFEFSREANDKSGPTVLDRLPRTVLTSSTGIAENESWTFSSFRVK
jgi:hypothetical protein